MTRIVCFLSFVLLLSSCNLFKRWDIQINGPLDGSVVTSETPTVRVWGTLKEVTHIVKGEEKEQLPIDGRVECNGKTASLYPATKSWVFEKFPLVEGKNTITCSYIAPKYTDQKRITVVYQPHNTPPTAAATITPSFGTAPLKVSFDASQSVDPDGSIQSYAWDFNDGTTGQGKIVSHTFATAKVYQVQLIVTDNAGATGSKQFSITVNAPQNTPPVARFTPDLTEGFAPLIVHVDASASYDSDGSVIDYRWNWGDSSALSSGVQATHTFTTPGVYTVQLTVKDNAGATNSISNQIFVKAPPVYPVAEMTIFPTTIHAMDTVSLDASSSYLPGHESEVGKGIAECTWSYTSTSKKRSKAKSAALNCQTTTQFTQAGRYRITLTAMGTNGLSTTHDDIITVLPAIIPDPVVDFSMDLGNATIPFTANFDGSLSYLPGHENEANRGIANCTWTLSGATGDKTIPGCQDSRLITAKGTYSIRLTITDINGKSASISKTFQALAPVNQSPVANFSSHMGSGRQVDFDATASHDPDGSIVSYSWDFNDGSSGSGVTPSHTYSADGTYSVQLVVTDNEGATHSITKQIVVSANQTPSADFSYEVNADNSVNFDASTSSDPDGEIIRYDWNFGDGNTGSGATVSHAYDSPGTYTVVLTVIDNANATSTLSRDVVVGASPMGPINLNFENASLDGWLYQGQVDFLFRCAVFDSKCISNELAPIISTGVEGQETAELGQYFVVPNKAVKLTGKYRFLTNELPPARLKNFDDFFMIVKIVGEQVTFIAQGNVQTTTLGAGVAGYTYASPIANFEISLIGERGKSIIIDFMVQNIDDRLVNSGLVITDLTLVEE